LFFFFLISDVFAQVTLTPAATTGNVKLCVGGGNVALSSIVIDEASLGNNEAIGGTNQNATAATFAISIPTGFEFVWGSESVTATVGGDLSNVAFQSTSATSFTIQLDIANSGASDFVDAITISGLRVRAVSGGSQTVNLFRSDAAGVFIDGFGLNAVVGTVSSSAIQTALPVSASALTVCEGGNVSISIDNSQNGIVYEVLSLSNASFSATVGG